MSRSVALVVSSVLLALACGGGEESVEPSDLVVPEPMEAPPGMTEAAPAAPSAVNLFTPPANLPDRVSVLCGVDDEILFNCTLPNNATLSVCASRDPGGWMQIRGGTPAAPEVAVPAVADGSVGQFSRREIQNAPDAEYSLRRIITVEEPGRRSVLTLVDGLVPPSQLPEPTLMTLEVTVDGQPTRTWACEPRSGASGNSAELDSRVRLVD